MFLAVLAGTLAAYMSGNDSLAVLLFVTQVWHLEIAIMCVVRHIAKYIPYTW
jgi:hypothetical protein